MQKKWGKYMAKRVAAMTLAAAMAVSLAGCGAAIQAVREAVLPGQGEPPRRQGLHRQRRRLPRQKRPRRTAAGRPRRIQMNGMGR